MGDERKHEMRWKSPPKRISSSVQTKPLLLQSLKECVSSTKSAHRQPHQIRCTLLLISLWGSSIKNPDRTEMPFRRKFSLADLTDNITAPFVESQGK